MERPCRAHQIDLSSKARIYWIQSVQSLLRAVKERETILTDVTWNLFYFVQKWISFSFSFFTLVHFRQDSDKYRRRKLLSVGWIFFTFRHPNRCWNDRSKHVSKDNKLQHDMTNFWIDSLLQHPLVSLFRAVERPCNTFLYFVSQFSF